MLHSNWRAQIDLWDALITFSVLSYRPAASVFPGLLKEETMGGAIEIQMANKWTKLSAVTVWGGWEFFALS